MLDGMFLDYTVASRCDIALVPGVEFDEVGLPQRVTARAAMAQQGFVLCTG